jgi:hypothetical protein
MVATEESVPFVARVSKVKTRRKDGKDYFTFRINIPHEISERLNLNNGDYLFTPAATKAKWFHMLNWKEMNMTWSMLPQQLKNEIKTSGLETPESQPQISQGISITHPAMSALSVTSSPAVVQALAIQ